METKRAINKKKLIKLIILTIVVALSIFISFKLIKYVLPFVLAFTFASILKPAIELLNVKLKIKRGISTLICTLLFFMLIGTLMFFVILTLVNQITSIVNNLQGWINEISTPFQNIIYSLNNLGEYFPNLSEELASGLTQISNSLFSYLADLAKNAGQFIVSKAISIPSAIIFMFITVLATYFYAKDRKYFKDLLSKQLPDTWIEIFYENRKNITGTLVKWLKAQGLILSITFTELLIGFSIIQVKYALILALVTALIDILPVLGTGTILIPWIIINIILGNTSLAIKLAILYIFETSVRQLIEPKIVGKGIGIHPLVTLFAMYIGVHFFGVLGFLIGPIYIMIFKTLMQGILDNKKIIEYITFRTKVKEP